MNVYDLLLIILIAAAVVFVIFRLIKKRRRNGPCGICPYAGSCSGHCTYPGHTGNDLPPTPRKKEKNRQS